jgi:hypothetical protein
MSKKIINIKEKELLDIIQNVISEQTANDKEIIISGGFGQAGNRFSDLGDFIKKITDTINKELQGETPYKIRMVKKGAANGVVAEHGKSGEEKTIKINLIPSKEEERYYFFACSAAIYSEAADFNLLLSEVRASAARKSRLFTSKTVYNLGIDLLDLSDFTNLNPQEPDKKYKLMLAYFAGTSPQVMTPGQGFEATPSTKTQATEPVKTEAKKVTKNVSGSFTSNDGDSAHNFKEMETKLDQVLVEMYNSGINPKITAIDASISKNNNQFTTTYNATVSNSTDGKAWMGFTSRGSFGTDYKKRADGQISGSENADKRSLEEKLKTNLGAGEIEIITTYEDPNVPVKQYFVQFTKPEKYPAK